MTWDKVTTEAELQHKMLRFLAGELQETPWHRTPLDPESTLIIERLVRLTELGLITTCSQPGMAGSSERQRAFVEGLVNDAVVPVLREVAGAHGYIWSENSHREGAAPSGNRVVTYDAGIPYSHITEGTAYPIDEGLPEGLRAVVRGMTVVTVADPTWGSNQMFDALIDALESRP